MGGSKSKPALQLRATKDNLEVIVIDGKKARVFDTSKKTQANLVHLGYGALKNDGSERDDRCSGSTKMCFSNDGKFYLMYDNYCNSIVVLSAENGFVAKKIEVPEEEHEYIEPLAITKDNKYIYAGYDGCNDIAMDVLQRRGKKEILVFDVETGKLVTKIEGHKSAISFLTTSRDGKYLASGDRGSNIMIWDISADPLKPKPVGNPIKTQDPENGAILDLAFGFGPSANFLYAVSDGNNLRPRMFGYKIDDPEHRQVNGHGIFNEEFIYQISISADGKHLLGALEQKKARIYEIDGEGYCKPKKDIENLSSHSMGVACSPVSNIAVICNRDDSVWLYDLETGNSLSKNGIELGAFCYPPRFSPDGKTLAVSTSSFGDVRFYGVVYGEEVGTERQVSDKDFVGKSVAFSDDGASLIVTGGEEGKPVKETLKL